MRTVNATTARTTFFRLMDELTEAHEPVVVTGRRHNIVMLPEEDWRGIQETLFLLSIPGLRKDLLKGKATPLDTCGPEEALEW